MDDIVEIMEAAIIEYSRQYSVTTVEKNVRVAVAALRAAGYEIVPVATVADTARLDWLDDVNKKINVRYGTKYGWKFDVNHNRAALSDHNVPALTVRQAIDAAMLAAKGDGNDR